MIKSLLFAIVAYVLGILSAIPVGAVQIEVARRAVQGHLKSAMVVILGAVLVDVFYGFVALFGILPVLKSEEVMAVFWLFGSFFLVYLAFLLFNQGLSEHHFNKGKRKLKKKRLSFLTGFSLSLINPMMIFWWLLGERIFVELSLVEKFTPERSIEFIVLAASGMFTYAGSLAVGLYWLKRFIPEKVIMKFTLGSAVVVLLFAVYLFVKSLITLLL
ncbi:MAG: hypothetical protein D6778_09200 [Nitrospirae bacterium]|nr:MAG: hypothetical protein D6778_09200 [Nitrospirota bacterium]